MLPALALNVTWDDSEPFQVHWATPETAIIRQSLAAHYEAPFLYLLFGRDRALLLDTGATVDSPLRAVIDDLLAHRGTGYGLVVAHSHSHTDHIAGDAQFAGRPDTIVIDPSVAVKSLDLGGRLLTVLPIPGHHATSIAMYDSPTGLLLTGDTVYPGRLYVDDFEAFASSIRLLCHFADANAISAILGAHIEMTTTPGKDIPVGSRHHVDEAPLPMTVAQLHDIRDALAIAETPGRHQFPDFAIWTE